MLNNLLNVLLGVIASLIGWLILAKMLRPRIILGDKIDRVIRKDSSEYYRLTYKNPRIRRVEDVQVTARIFRRVAMRPDARRVWESCDIPLNESFRPVLGRLSFTKRMLRYLRGGRRLVQHSTMQLEEIEGNRFTVNLPDGCPPITHLDEFLRETDGTIEFAVRAADGFSGVYRTVAKVYKAEDISIIDRRAQQAAGAPEETDSGGTCIPSATAPREARPDLLKSSRARMLQLIRRVRQRLTASTGERGKSPAATTDSGQGGNSHTAERAQSEAQE